MNKFKHMLFLISCCFIASLVLAEPGDNDLSEIEESLYFYFNGNAGSPVAPHKKRLTEIGEILDSQLVATPNSPVLHYYKTLYFIGMGMLRVEELGGSMNARNDEIKKQYFDEAINFITRAMELDESYQPHLTGVMYHLIAPALQTDLRVEAYRRELKLGVAVGYPAGRVDVYYRITGAYREVGRYAEAVNVLKEMLNDPQIEPSYYDNIRSTLQRREKELIEMQTNGSMPNEQIVEGKGELAEQDTKQVKPETIAKAHKPEISTTKPEVADNNYFLELIIIGLVFAVFIAIYLFRIKRRK